MHFCDRKKCSGFVFPDRPRSEWHISECCGKCGKARFKRVRSGTSGTGYKLEPQSYFISFDTQVRGSRPLCLGRPVGWLAGVVHTHTHALRALRALRARTRAHTHTHTNTHTHTHTHQHTRVPFLQEVVKSFFADPDWFEAWKQGRQEQLNNPPAGSWAAGEV